jgi:hypothetical protein
MKKAIQILSLLLLPNALLMAQIKMENLEKKPSAEGTPQYKSWFRGFDMMLQTVQTKTEGSANVTPVHEQYKNPEINFGYQKGKHKWEIGLAVERDDNSFYYENKVNGSNFGKSWDYATVNTRLGYSYQIYKINQRTNIDLGVGINWTYWLGGSILQPETSVGDKNIVANYKQVLEGKNAIGIDGKLQINYALSPHWQAHFFYQYRYAPQPLTSARAIYTNAQTGAYLEDARIKSTPSAIIVGLGLQYYVQPLYERIVKATVREQLIKKIHVGLEFGLVQNTGSRKSTVNTGAITDWDPIALISTKLGVNVGYRIGQHDVEIGYQTLNSFLNFQFDNIANRRQSRDDGFGLKAHYLPLRYYYSLFPDRKKWRIDVGTGLGLARFIEQEPTEFTEKTTLQETITFNNQRVSYSYLDQERMDHRQTACFEGNVRLRRLMYNEHWQFNLWGRYIYNPWSVRTVKFDIKYSNQPPRFGEVSTSFTSFGIGAGLSYLF